MISFFSPETRVLFMFLILSENDKRVCAKVIQNCRKSICVKKNLSEDYFSALSSFLFILYLHISLLATCIFSALPLVNISPDSLAPWYKFLFNWI